MSFHLFVVVVALATLVLYPSKGEFTDVLRQIRISRWTHYASNSTSLQKVVGDNAETNSQRKQNTPGFEMSSIRNTDWDELLSLWFEHTLDCEWKAISQPLTTNNVYECMGSGMTAVERNMNVWVSEMLHYFSPVEQQCFWKHLTQRWFMSQVVIGFSSHPFLMDYNTMLVGALFKKLL